MSHIRTPLLASFVALGMLGGCAPGTDASSQPADNAQVPGPAAGAPAQGATFHFGMSRGCNPWTGDACPIDRPILVGAQELVRMHFDNLEVGAQLDAISGDTAVISITSTVVGTDTLHGYNGNFYVRAVGRGDAAVAILEHLTHRTVALVPLHADEAARIDLVQEGPLPGEGLVVDRIEALPGHPASMFARVSNAAGVALYANDAVTWSVLSTDVASLQWSEQSGARVQDDHVFVNAVAAGTTTVIALAGNVQHDAPVFIR